MLDSSRREVLVSAVVNSVPDVVAGVATALVVRLTGIEALGATDDDATDDADAASAVEETDAAGTVEETDAAGTVENVDAAGATDES